MLLSLALKYLYMYEHIQYFCDWLIEKELQSLSNVLSLPEFQEFTDDVRHNIYK